MGLETRHPDDVRQGIHPLSAGCEDSRTTAQTCHAAAYMYWPHLYHGPLSPAILGANMGLYMAMTVNLLVKDGTDGGVVGSLCLSRVICKG